MKNKLYILFAAIVTLVSGISFAQNPVAPQAIEFNKKVHNFGKVSINDGAQHCIFEFTNTSANPVVISNIISSCGCTTPVWPKKPVMPGEKGKVEVTYLNDQGPFPFDKTLTVYTSASAKPIILRITGLAYENERSLKEMFPVPVGVLGVKNNVIKGGQIAQGNSKSGSFKIANISNKAVSVKFANVSAGLNISIEPQNIPAGEIAEVSYTVDTKAATNWGKTRYTADVMCNGIKAPAKIEVECMIIDNFEKLSKEEKNKGAMVIAQSSSFNYGTVAAGKPVTATFSLRNTGHSALVVHKADTDSQNVKVSAPQSVGAGEKFTVTATVETSGLKGEHINTITLVTNSPNRPLVNLFVIGEIK